MISRIFFEKYADGRKKLLKKQNICAIIET